MSGLVGWVDFRRDLGARPDALHAMTATAPSRAADGAGSWTSQHVALGHRAATATATATAATATATATAATATAGAGGGPALAETGRGVVAVTCTGVPANDAQLRQELGGPAGGGDGGCAAETLLRAYLRWDAGLVDRLDGMFAFAIWDGRTQELLLGRDRFGMKPLYFVEYPGGVLFASAPEAIMAHEMFEARLDVEALPILLQPRLALGGETPLVGLREVPAAHTVSFSEAGSSARRYWRLTSVAHDESFDATARRVRELLEDSVRHRLAGSGPCGAMLSGGVDSTSVAALATRMLAQRGPGAVLDTFCVEFASDPAHFVGTELRPDVDSPYAALAADLLGTRHTTITATMSDLLEVIPATRRARGMPGWGQFDASMYLLFREMRDRCTVALSGEAADEFFGGYPYFFRPELTGRDTFPWMGTGPKLSDYLSPEVRAVVDPQEDERSRYAQLMSEVPRLPGEDPENARMREVLFLGMAGPLAVILDRKERMSAALGLEVRLPFCDHRLVEYAWNVPWSMKCAGGVKGLLKAAMADLLPPATVERRKSAYPHLQDPHYDRLLIREATAIVNDEDSPMAWMFDTARLNALIRQIATRDLRSSLPGGVSGAQLLIQLVEARSWIDDHQVAVR